jgi:hypothetical protein
MGAVAWIVIGVLGLAGIIAVTILLWYGKLERFRINSATIDVQGSDSIRTVMAIGKLMEETRKIERRMFGECIECMGRYEITEEGLSETDRQLIRTTMTRLCAVNNFTQKIELFGIEGLKDECRKELASFNIPDAFIADMLGKILAIALLQCEQQLILSRGILADTAIYPQFRVIPEQWIAKNERYAAILRNALLQLKKQ